MVSTEFISLALSPSIADDKTKIKIGAFLRKNSLRVLQVSEKEIIAKNKEYTVIISTSESEFWVKKIIKRRG